jgi:hypothetical protein
MEVLPPSVCIIIIEMNFMNIDKLLIPAIIGGRSGCAIIAIVP